MARIGGGKYSAALWAIVRAAYEGRDPERMTSERIRVEAIAADFGIHANSIWMRCKEWRRPDWYSQAAGPGTAARARREQPAEKRRALLLGALRQAAAGRLPCPTVYQLGKLVDLEECSVRRLLKRLIKAGLFSIEWQGNTRRRFVFPDGTATDWNMPPNPLGGKTGAAKARSAELPQRRYRPCNVVDLCARDAARLLRRNGGKVFDLGVIDGRWGERWDVDGKIVDRAGLLECARLHPSTSLRAGTAGIPPAVAAAAGGVR